MRQLVKHLSKLQQTIKKNPEAYEKPLDFIETYCHILSLHSQNEKELIILKEAYTEKEFEMLQDLATQYVVFLNIIEE